MGFSDQFLSRVASQLDLNLLFRFQNLSRRTYKAGYQVTALNNIDLHKNGLNKILVRYNKVQHASILSPELVLTRPIGVLFYRYWVNLRSLSFTFQRCDVFINFFKASLAKGHDATESEKSLLALTDLSITIYTTGDSKYYSPLSVFPPIHAAKIKRLFYDCKFEMRVPSALKNFTNIQELTFYGPSEPNFRLVSMPNFNRLKHLVVHKANLYPVEILGILKSNKTIETLEIYALSLDPPQDDMFSLVTICSDLKKRDGTTSYDEQDNQCKQAFKKKYRLNPYETVTNLRNIIISTAEQVPLDVIILITACSPYLTKLSISNSVFISRHFIKETSFLDILKENFTCHSALSLARVSDKEEEKEEERQKDQDGSGKLLVLSSSKSNPNSISAQQDNMSPEADLSGIKRVKPVIAVSTSSQNSSMYSGLESNADVNTLQPFSSTIKAHGRDTRTTSDSLSTPELTSSVAFEQNDMSNDDLKTISLKNYLPSNVADTLAQIQTEHQCDNDSSSDDTIPSSLFKQKFTNSTLPSFQIKYSGSQPQLGQQTAPYSSVSNIIYGDNVPDSTFSFQSSIYSMSNALHNTTFTMDGFHRDGYGSHLTRNRGILPSNTNVIQSKYNDNYNNGQDSTLYVMMDDETDSRFPSNNDEDSNENRELDGEHGQNHLSSYRSHSNAFNANNPSFDIMHHSAIYHQASRNRPLFVNPPGRVTSNYGSRRQSDYIHENCPLSSQINIYEKSKSPNKQHQRPYDSKLSAGAFTKDGGTHGKKNKQRSSSTGKCSATSTKFFTKYHDNNISKQSSNDNSQCLPAERKFYAAGSRKHMRVYSSMNDYGKCDILTTVSARTDTQSYNSDEISTISTYSHRRSDNELEEKIAMLPLANLDTNFSCSASLPPQTKILVIPSEAEERNLNKTENMSLESIQNNVLSIASAKGSPHTSTEPSPSASLMSSEQTNQFISINLSKTEYASNSYYKKCVTESIGIPMEEKLTSLNSIRNLFNGPATDDTNSNPTTKQASEKQHNEQNQQHMECQTGENVKLYTSSSGLFSHKKFMEIPHNPDTNAFSTFHAINIISSKLNNMYINQDIAEDSYDLEKIMSGFSLPQHRPMSAHIVCNYEYAQSHPNPLISERSHATKCFTSYDDAWAYVGDCRKWTDDDKDVIKREFYQRFAWNNAAIMCQRYERTYMDMAQSAGVLDDNTDANGTTNKDDINDVRNTNDAASKLIIAKLYQSITLKGPKQLRTAFLWSHYHMLSPISDDCNFIIRGMQNEQFQAKMNIQLAAIEPFFNTNIPGKPFYQTKTANTGYIEKIILTSNKLRASMTVVANASVNKKELGAESHDKDSIVSFDSTLLPIFSQNTVVSVVSDKQLGEKAESLPEEKNTKSTEKNNSGLGSEKSALNVSSYLAFFRKKSAKKSSSSNNTQFKKMEPADEKAPDLIQSLDTTESNTPGVSSGGSLEQSREGRKISEQQNTLQLLDIFRKDIQLIDLHEVHDIYDLPFNKNLVSEPDKMFYFDGTVKPDVDQMIGEIITHDMLENDKKEHVQRIGDSFEGFSQATSNTLFCNILLVSTLSRCITRIHMPSIHLSADDIILMADRFKNLKSLEIGSLPTPTSDFRDALSVKDKTDDVLDQRPRAKSDGGAVSLDGASNPSANAAAGFKIPAFFSQTIISFPSMTELFLRNGYMVDMLLILQLFPNLKSLQLENCVLLNTITNEMAFSSTNEFRKQFVLEELIVIGSLKTDRMTLRNIMLLLRDTLTTVYLNRTRIPLHNIWRNNVVYMPRLRCLTLQSVIYDETTEMDEYIARYPNMANYGRCSLSLLDMLAVITCYPNLESLSFSQLHTFDYGGVHEAVSSTIILRILDYLFNKDDSHHLKHLKTLSLWGASEGDIDVFISTMGKICDMKALTRVSLGPLFCSDEILKRLILKSLDTFQMTAPFPGTRSDPGDLLMFIK